VLYLKKGLAALFFNVVVGLRRLGVSVSFLTKVGGDEFAQGLMDIIRREKIIANV